MHAGTLDLWRSQSERTLPIIMSLIPTLIGSGLLVGLKSTPDHKGVLLFGKLLALTRCDPMGNDYCLPQLCISSLLTAVPSRLSMLITQATPAAIQRK